MSWIPASQPPQIEPGEIVNVIVATRSKPGGRWCVYGGLYLNQYELSEWDDEEESGVWTGFYVDYKHDYFDEYYEAIDDVLFWQPTPEPPGEEV